MYDLTMYWDQINSMQILNCVQPNKIVPEMVKLDDGTLAIQVTIPLMNDRDQKILINGERVRTNKDIEKKVLKNEEIDKPYIISGTEFTRKLKERMDFDELYEYEQEHPDS